MFTNALRTHSRLRVLTSTRIALPATRGITSLVAFRTAVSKNVSLSVSRSFTTTQVAREESQLTPKELEGSQLATEEFKDSQGAANELEDSQITTEGLEGSQVAANESEDSQVATEGLEDSQVAANEFEDSQVATEGLEDSQVAANELEDSQVTTEGLEDSQLAPKELEDSPVVTEELEGSRVAPKVLEDSQVAPKDLEDSAPRAPLEPLSNTIFVANMDWKTTEDDIRQAFSQFGEITGLRHHFYFDGRPRGTCHIDFASKDSVVAAKTSIAEKPLQIRDRNLRIEYSDGIIRKQNAVPSYKLFYSGCNCDESEILAIFQQFSESILKVFRLRNPRGEGLQSGYILFNNVENATKALETLQGTQTPKGETLNLAYARAQKKAVKCRRLYYSGCNGDESEILTIFQQFSKSIIEVCVLKDSSAGSGFIRFDKVTNATKALETLKGTQTTKGETLHLDYARPRKDEKRRRLNQRKAISGDNPQNFI